MDSKPLKVVVIGGDAAGMSAASQVKRRVKTAHVVVLEKSEDVSYGACGMPYNISRKGDINELTVMSATQFKEKRGLDVRLLNEGIGVDTKERIVNVKNVSTGRTYDINYDKLVIATGARAVKMPIEGVNQDGVFSLKFLDDARRIKRYIDEKNPQKAVLIGGGYINLELAETYKTLGMDVVLLKKSDKMSGMYEDEVEEAIKLELKKNDVKLYTGVDIEKIEDDKTVVTNKGAFKTDLVSISKGIIPNTEFLEGTDIELSKGAIVIDRYAATTNPNVYAGGDCALIYNKLLKRNVFMPLGTNANKIGKLAGANIAGANEKFAGIVGTSVLKLFDIAVAKTGLSLKEAQDEGYDAFKTVVTTKTRAHGFPNPKDISVIFITEKNSGRLLGCQIFGGEGVALRIDVMATALFADMTIKDIQGLDLAYSPPFAPVWDPILVCANQAIKKV